MCKLISLRASGSGFAGFGALPAVQGPLGCRRAQEGSLRPIRHHLRPAMQLLRTQVRNWSVIEDN